MEAPEPKNRTFLDHFTLFWGFALPLGFLGLIFAVQGIPGFAAIIILSTMCLTPLILIPNFRRATEGEPTKWKTAHGVATVMILLIYAIPVLIFFVQTYLERKSN